MSVNMDELDEQAQDRARIEFTLTVRENIVKDLTSNGSVPKDKASMEFLISALDGMDRTVLAKAKLKVDAKTNDISSQSNALIATLLSQVNTKQIKNQNYDPNNSIPVLEMKIDDSSIIPGETLIGIVEETHDDFIKRMGN